MHTQVLVPNAEERREPILQTSQSVPFIEMLEQKERILDPLSKMRRIQDFCATKPKFVNRKKEKRNPGSSSLRVTSNRCDRDHPPSYVEIDINLRGEERYPQFVPGVLFCIVVEYRKARFLSIHPFLEG
jgi:hypothetical protein